MGPWQESAHHHKMVGILSDYCRTRATEDPLWLESNPLLQQRRSMVKTGRWHGFASKAPQLREVSACLVFIPEVLGSLNLSSELKCLWR
eukprot:637864-Amphidinium_carterae.3